jgi:hypothetical protein
MSRIAKNAPLVLTAVLLAADVRAASLSDVPAENVPAAAKP